MPSRPKPGPPFEPRLACHTRLTLERELRLPQLVRGLLDQWKTGQLAFCSDVVDFTLNCLLQGRVDADAAQTHALLEAHVLGSGPTAALQPPWTVNTELPQLLERIGTEARCRETWGAPKRLIDDNIRSLARRAERNLDGRVWDYVELKVDERYLNVDRLLRLLMSDEVVAAYGGCDDSPTYALDSLYRRVFGTAVQSSEVLARATARYDQLVAMGELAEDPFRKTNDLRDVTLQLDRLMIGTPAAPGGTELPQKPPPNIGRVIAGIVKTSTEDEGHPGAVGDMLARRFRDARDSEGEAALTRLQDVPDSPGRLEALAVAINRQASGDPAFRAELEWLARDADGPARS